MAKAVSEKIMFYGTGRRKKSIARVRITNGNGKITINNKTLDEFFGVETLKVIVKQPLVSTNSLDKFDVVAKVTGGGISGQAGAVRPYFLRSFILASLVKKPADLRTGLYSAFASTKALAIPCLTAPA